MKDIKERSISFAGIIEIKRNNAKVISSIIDFSIDVKPFAFITTIFKILLKTMMIYNFNLLLITGLDKFCLCNDLLELEEHIILTISPVDVNENPDQRRILIKNHVQKDLDLQHSETDVKSEETRKDIYFCINRNLHEKNTEKNYNNVEEFLQSSDNSLNTQNEEMDGWVFLHNEWPDVITYRMHHLVESKKMIIYHIEEDKELDYDFKVKLEKYQEMSFSGFQSDERKNAWSFLLNISNISRVGPFLLCEHPEADVIDRDLFRLEKNSDFLKLEEHEKTSFLSKIRKILSMVNQIQPSLGYFQGLDYIVFMLMFHFKHENINEDDLVAILISLLDRIYKKILKNKFKSFDQFAKITEEKIKKFKPYLLQKIDFENFKQSIMLEYYITLFCRFKSEIAIRFLDVFCAFGEESLHFFILGILECLEKEIEKSVTDGKDKTEFISELKNNLIPKIDIEILMVKVKYYLCNNNTTTYQDYIKEKFKKILK